VKRPVTVVLGTRRISREHLQALEAGSVIALEEGADAPVTVYIGRKAIGTGKLVSLGGKLAVRISRLEYSRTGGKDEI